MSIGIKPIHVIRQETIVLLRTKPIVAERVHLVVKVKYNEPIFNLQIGSIVKGVLGDWNKGIHSVNRIPRPNSPRCTYCN